MYKDDDITAELGRVLAVVKVTSQVNKNRKFPESHPSKTINIQDHTTDYTREGNLSPTFGDP